MREQSIIAGFDAARIRGDAENQQPKSLTAYLDELRPAEETFEDGVAALAAQFDAEIARHFGGSC